LALSPISLLPSTNPNLILIVAAGLYTLLTAAMGKRTKYQQTEHAQMFLVARSSLLKEGEKEAIRVRQRESVEVQETNGMARGDYSEIAADKRIEGEKRERNEGYKLKEKEKKEEEEVSGWTHGEWELGKRLIAEEEGGEEVAVREVMLDSADGGAAENILLEGGPSFSVSSEDRGVDGGLHPVDQAVILALCLDVENRLGLGILVLGLVL
jgi:hypothetical protein